MTGNTSTSSPLDVAIIGGGIAGLFSGWRLTSQTAGIAVFESSPRVGGRLLSVHPPGMANTACELGGMRIISNQHRVVSLVKTLGISTKELAASKPENLSFLRGHRLQQKALKQEASKFYGLRKEEQGKSPGELLVYALDKLVPGVSTMSDEEYAEVYQNFRINGRHLYELGFWNLLLTVLSNEAYNLVQDASGYYSITTNWNAGDAIGLCLGDFRPDTKYHGFPDGFEQLAKRLSSRFEEAGGIIHLDSALQSFDVATLDDGTEGLCLKIKNQSDATEHTVYARKLILALPRRSIELLSQTGAVLGSHSSIHQLLPAVEPIPLFKLFVKYPEAWWEQAPLALTTGESITDLPLRQCYYWGKEGKQGVLLASYNDVRETRFWEGLQKINTPDDFFDNVEATAKDDEWLKHKAPLAMVEEIHRQLKLLHGVENIPEPVAAAYRNWSEAPYGGGVHFWNQGYNSARVQERIIHPIPNTPVFIVGEAYSNKQGWVEGCLETSENMLTRYFGLSDPDWLSP